MATGGSGLGLATISAPVALIVAGLGFVAGVPHGAADHVIAAGLAGDRPMVLVAAVYAGVAVCAWALLRWADPTALIVAVALGALHFGLGELEVVRRLCHWRPGPGMAAAIVVASCGALLLPLARCGDQLSAVATTISPDLATVIGRTPVQQGLVAVWLLAALVAIVGSLRSGHPAVALDVVIVGAVGMLAPPLVAFAVWFGGWHALRHCGRLLTQSRARLRRPSDRWPTEGGGAAIDPTGRSAHALRPGRCWPPSAGSRWPRPTRPRCWPTCCAYCSRSPCRTPWWWCGSTVPARTAPGKRSRRRYAGGTTQVGNRRLISNAANAASASTSEPNRSHPTLASPRIVS